MTERVDVVVIGAGVIGLAVGRALAQRGRDVIVLEKNSAIGEETSSRNSEVIHAGIYYTPGGLRARFCVAGKKLLYQFCTDHNVARDNCEKMIVAYGEEEITGLRALKQKSEQNGVDDLRLLTGAQAAKLEPALKCDAALLSPSTGIVDSHGLMLAYLGGLEDAGGALALLTPVVCGKVCDDSIELQTGGDHPMTLEARLLVNCAGLWSDRVAHSIAGLPGDTIPELRYGKGRYFTYAGAAPFSRLIYPLPQKDSLGAHYTRDLGGQAKLGPDIAYIDTNDDYSVDPALRDDFAASARRFWPDLEADRLNPGYAGIRPKTAGPGEEGDFVIHGRETHGIDAYIGLYGIESPGLTSSLAIADYVAQLARI